MSKMTEMSMKKLIVMTVLFGALAIGSRATYAGDGWSTAGKILTGVLAADLVFNHLGYGHGHHHGSSSYGFSYGDHGRYSGYSVHYSSGPCYYSRPPAYHCAPLPQPRCVPRHYRGYRAYPAYRW